MDLVNNPSGTLHTLGNTAVILGVLSVAIAVLMLWRLALRALTLPIAIILALPFVIVAVILLGIAEVITRLVIRNDYRPLAAAYAAVSRRIAGEDKRANPRN
jgi:hypothetical protein